jgi:hypothetical protein
MSKKDIFFKIWGFRGSDNENLFFLADDIMRPGRYIPNIREANAALNYAVS